MSGHDAPQRDFLRVTQVHQYLRDHHGVHALRGTSSNWEGRGGMVSHGRTVTKKVIHIGVGGDGWDKCDHSRSQRLYINKNCF